MFTLLTSTSFLLLGLLIAAVVLLQPGSRRDVGGSTVISLPRSPNHVSGPDVARLFALISFKHVLPSFTRYTAPFRQKAGAAQEFTLPCVRVEGLLSVTKSDLDAFNKSVVRNGEAPSDEVNPFFLVAQTVPLTINILAHRDCPVKPLGAVNTKNKIQFVDPAFSRSWSKIEAASRDGRLSYHAVFGGLTNPGYRRKRGVEFNINVVIVCDKREIIQQELWFLQNLPKSFSPRYNETASLSNAGPTDDRAQYLADIATPELAMTPRDPKRWAATSKDYNPIHVSSMGAKIFGFKSVIAHGNHVAALAMQQVLSATGGAQAEAKQLIWHAGLSGLCVELRFVRPTTLPSRLLLHWSKEEGGSGKVKLIAATRDKDCVIAYIYDLATR